MKLLTTLLGLLVDLGYSKHLPRKATVTQTSVPALTSHHGAVFQTLFNQDSFYQKGIGHEVKPFHCTAHQNYKVQKNNSSRLFIT